MLYAPAEEFDTDDEYEGFSFGDEVNKIKYIWFYVLCKFFIKELCKKMYFYLV